MKRKMKCDIQCFRLFVFILLWLFFVLIYLGIGHL